MKNKQSDNKNVICLYKQIGETPLECLDRFRASHSEYEKEKLSYAGRLDPMAEGLLLVLVGDENKNREQYLGLDKCYECEILFGVTTDSFDLLGLVQNVSGRSPNIEKETLESLAKKLEGKRKMKYPPFSSKTVEGKPLWQWTREGGIDDVDIPTRQVEIKVLRLEEIRAVEKSYIINYIINYITDVKGDFRQSEITKEWETALSTTKVQEFPIAKFTVNCSSGTYIRRLADMLGEKLETGALAFSIKRTSVGEFDLDDVVNL